MALFMDGSAAGSLQVESGLRAPRTRSLIVPKLWKFALFFFLSRLTKRFFLLSPSSRSEIVFTRANAVKLLAHNFHPRNRFGIAAHAMRGS